MNGTPFNRGWFRDVAAVLISPFEGTRGKTIRVSKNRPSYDELENTTDDSSMVA